MKVVSKVPEKKTDVKTPEYILRARVSGNNSYAGKCANCGELIRSEPHQEVKKISYNDGSMHEKKYHRWCIN